MYYYYDFLVNLDTELWSFYEWEEEDNIKPIKKSPFIRVNEKDIQNFIQYNVVFPKEFVSLIEDKTIVKNQKEHLTGVLFSSGKNSLFLELGQEGEVISRSYLLIEDDNNSCELSYSMKKEALEYEIKEKNPVHLEFRQAQKERHFIEIELKTLKETKNEKKCAYLYYEWFGELGHDFHSMITRLEEELQKNYNEKWHDIANLIRLSYKEIS